MQLYHIRKKLWSLKGPINPLLTLLKVCRIYGWKNFQYDILEQVTRCEIQKIVMSLKHGAAGYDEINSGSLKLSLQYMCEPQVYICNISLIQGMFPQIIEIS